MENERAEKMVRIAVTGGAASGKSTVCNYLEQKGLPVIRLDDVARDVVCPGMPAYNEIVGHFGKKVIQRDGSLNRALLREIITRNQDEKRRIEGWVQPQILHTMERRIRDYVTQGKTAVVVEIPLLFELNMEKDFDISLLVAVNPDIQVKRLVARDGVSSESAWSLINIQMPLEEKRKRADIIVENNGGLEDLVRSMDKVFEKDLKNSISGSKELDS